RGGCRRLVARHGEAHRSESQLHAAGRRGEARDRGGCDLRRGVSRGSAARRRGSAQPSDDAARIRAAPVALATTASAENARNANASHVNAVLMPAASAIAPKIGAAMPPTGWLMR